MQKELEIRTYSDELNVAIRSSEDGAKMIEGYAVVFGVRSNLIYDWMAGEALYETIERSAFSQSDIDKWDICATLDHDFKQLLARSNKGRGSLNLTIDQKGLKYEFEVPDTVDGERAYERVKRGELFGSSFMFSFDEKTGCSYTRDANKKLCRSVTKIDKMYDVSLVRNPAYSASSVSRRSLEDCGVLEKESKDYLDSIAKMERQINYKY